jgi:hypothetical protein
VLIGQGHRVSVLVDVLNTRMGDQLDMSTRLNTFEQCVVGIHTVNHGIWIAKPLLECSACGNETDLVFVDGVMHDHVVCVDRTTSGLFTHTQGIKGMESIRAELHARTDFTDAGRLLQHLDMEPLLSQGQRGSQATNATTSHQDG